VARNSDTNGVVKFTLHSNSADFAFVPEAGKSFKDSGTITCHSPRYGTIRFRRESLIFFSGCMP
jgi:hypothetical protein